MLKGTGSKLVNLVFARMIGEFDRTGEDDAMRHVFAVGFIVSASLILSASVSRGGERGAASILKGTAGRANYR